jgi:hypothetical protein
MRTVTRTDREATRRSRFGRSSGAARSSSPAAGGRFARPAPPPRWSGPVQGFRRRREPEPSGIKKLVSAGTARKAVPTSKKGKAGGLALVAAAVGVAIRNRQKLPGMRGKGADSPASSSTNASTPPTPHGV